ncbi:MAG: PAS domain S-box protein [Elainellaceae cyanobacterium]
MECASDELKLYENEEFFYSIFNGVQEGIFVVDAIENGEFRYVGFNLAYERLTGLSSSDIRGKTPHDLLPTDAATVIEQHYRECVATQTRITYEECLPFNGHETWWITNLTPLHDRHARVHRIIGTSTEITDRKYAEKLVQIQVEREKLIVDSIQRLSQSLNFHDILQTTVDEVRRFLQTDRVVIYRFNPDLSGSMVTESVIDSALSILGITIKDTCFRDKYANAYRFGRIQMIEDVYTTNLAPCYLEQLEHLRVRANLVVPIVRGDTLWGLLIAHQCVEPRSWQHIEVDLLQQLASKLAIAVQQSELYEQAQAELAERKRTEAALLKSQTRFQNLVANVPGMIYQFLLHPDGSVEFPFLSSGCREIYGIEPIEVERNPSLLMDTIHSGDRPSLDQSTHISAQTLEPWRWEGRFIHSSGAIKWMRAAARPQKQPNGDIIWDGVITDTTEARHAEERLRLLESVIIHANDAIIITEAEPITLPGPRIVYVNPAFSHNTGYQPEEVIGKTPRILQGQQSDRHELDRISAALQRWQPVQAELVNYHKDGTEFWVDVNIVPIADASGYYTHWMAIQRDITDRKRAEAEILRTLNRERELNELRSKFISVTSHEFRTPLTTIQSSADLLRHFNCNKQEQDELFEQIQNSITHMVRLLEDVLFIGHNESGKLEFRPTFLDLAEVCQHLVAEVETGMYHRCPIHLNYQGDRRPVSLDEKLLRQILTNLLANAVKYSLPNSPVSLDIDCQANQAVFQVQDQGLGIPIEDQKRLFEWFHRGRNVETISGTGLGLFIVKQCVDLHRGHITVDSTLNHGSIFTVTLPTNL